MKTLCLSALLMAATAVAAPAQTENLAKEDKATSPPPVTTAPANEPRDQVGTPANQLAPFMVTESYQKVNRPVIREQPKNLPFNWTDGGYFARSGHRVVTSVKFQYHAGLQGYDLASVEW